MASTGNSYRHRKHYIKYMQQVYNKELMHLSVSGKPPKINIESRLSETGMASTMCPSNRQAIFNHFKSLISIFSTIKLIHINGERIPINSITELELYLALRYPS